MQVGWWRLKTDFYQSGLACTLLGCRVIWLQGQSIILYSKIMVPETVVQKSNLSCQEKAVWCIA